MSNTKREPLLSDEFMENHADKWNEGVRGITIQHRACLLQGADWAREHYEAALAKDAELIQDAVDEFHHLLMMRQDQLRAMKPAPPPNIMEMLLTQSATAKFYIDFLDKAEAAGFKPSDR